MVHHINNGEPVTGASIKWHLEVDEEGVGLRGTDETGEARWILTITPEGRLKLYTSAHINGLDTDEEGIINLEA